MPARCSAGHELPPLVGRPISSARRPYSSATEADSCYPFSQPILTATLGCTVLSEPTGTVTSLSWSRVTVGQQPVQSHSRPAAGPESQSTSSRSRVTVAHQPVQSHSQPSVGPESQSAISRSRVTVSQQPVQNHSQPAAGPESQSARALQWSGNPYGNGYGVEMDGNGAHFFKKILRIGLDLGQTVNLKRYDRYRIFTKHDICN